MKAKSKLVNCLKSIWFIKLIKNIYTYIHRDKSLCPICQRNPADKEYSGSCFNCYYKSLTKTRGNSK